MDIRNTFFAKNVQHIHICIYLYYLISLCSIITESNITEFICKTLSQCRKLYTLTFEFTSITVAEKQMQKSSQVVETEEEKSQH